MLIVPDFYSWGEAGDTDNTLKNCTEGADSDPVRPGGLPLFRITPENKNSPAISTLNVRAGLPGSFIMR